MRILAAAILSVFLGLGSGESRHKAEASIHTYVIDQVAPAIFLPGIDMFSGALSSHSLETTTAFPPLSVDFSTDKTFTIRMEAAAGKKFQVAPPSGFDRVSLNILVRSGSFFAAPFESLAMDRIVFEDLNGPTPTPGAEAVFEAAYGNDQFQAFGIADLGGNSSFAAAEATFTVPAAYDRSFVNFEAEDFGDVIFFFRAIGPQQGFPLPPQPDDPGNWAMLMDTANGVVLEPSAFFCWGLLGLCAALVARRDSRS